MGFKHSDPSNAITLDDKILLTRSAIRDMERRLETVLEQLDKLNNQRTVLEHSIEYNKQQLAAFQEQKEKEKHQ